MRVLTGISTRRPARRQAETLDSIEGFERICLGWYAYSTSCLRTPETAIVKSPCHQIAPPRRNDTMSSTDRMPRGGRDSVAGMRTASWRSNRLKPVVDDFGFVSKGQFGLGRLFVIDELGLRN